MLDESVPGSVGDYSAGIGTTGYDYTVSVKVNSTIVTIPPTGAFVQATGLRAADFTDGLSNTILLGEKHIYAGGLLAYPWDCNQYDGHNIVCSTRTGGPGFPIAQSLQDPRVLFGSAHVGICMFAFVDGGVRPVRKSLDEYSLGLLSSRNDGQVAPTDY